MAQQAKYLPPEPGNPSSIPRTHAGMQRRNALHKVVLRPPQMGMACATAPSTIVIR